MSELGCFGLPSTFDSSADVCRACPAFDPCGKSARLVLDALRASVSSDKLTDSLTLVHAPAVSDQKLGFRVAAAPLKVQPRLKRLLEGGFDRLAAAAFQEGRNPFPQGKNKVLWAMGTHLLNQGFHRALIADWCVIHLQWTRAAAQSQVSNEIALLRALELIDETPEGKLVLRQRAQAEITA